MQANSKYHCIEGNSILFLFFQLEVISLESTDSQVEVFSEAWTGRDF